MMKLFVLAVVLCESIVNGYGSNQQKPVGVGAYAFQDSDGHRYGGTYDLGEDDVPNFVQYAPGFPGPYARGGFPGQEYAGFPPGIPFASPDFGQEFFKYLQKSLSEAFPGNQFNQQAALRSVNTAFDHSFSNAGYQNPFQNSVPDHAAMQNFGNFQHPQGGNSAYAAGAISPQGVRQIASISPGNPNHPNVDVSSRSGNPGNGGFYSVSSSSFASSADVNGRKSETRGAKTVVNDNGNIKEYSVKN